MKLCQKCGELVSFNMYFGAYICKSCNHRDDKFHKERIERWNKAKR